MDNLKTELDRVRAAVGDSLDIRNYLDAADQAFRFLRTHGEALAGMVDRLAPCLWIQDAHDGSWDTACGNKNVFIHVDSADNLHAFCPYCGGRLIEPNYNDQAMQESRDE